MQYKLNERLLAVLYSERPLAFTDVAGLTGAGNTVQLNNGTAIPAAMVRSTLSVGFQCCALWSLQVLQALAGYDALAAGRTNSGAQTAKWGSQHGVRS